MSEIPQGYEVVSISLRPTLDKMALEIYQLENEICRLKKEVEEAETKGFKNGMLHAADIAERATMNTEDLSSNEKIAVVITAERIVAAILKDADG